MLVDAVRCCSLGQITNALFEVEGSTAVACSLALPLLDEEGSAVGGVELVRSRPITFARPMHPGAWDLGPRTPARPAVEQGLR